MVHEQLPSQVGLSEKRSAEVETKFSTTGVFYLTAEGFKLLDDVSTDNIIRVSDLLTDDVDTLGEKALCGLAPEYGIGEGSLKSKSVQVLVAGERFGRGSSREQAVLALLNAGIRVVLAPSFGPIFEKNAAYLGLYTSSNLELVKHFEKDEEIPFDEFLKGKDKLLQNIIVSGGLFRYLELINSGQIPEPKIDKKKDTAKGMNIFEQRMANALRIEKVLPDDSTLLPVDLAYSYVGLSGSARYALEKAYKKIKCRINPNNIFLFEDHFAYSLKSQIPLLTENQRRFAKELGLPSENYYFGKLNEGGGAGICHRVMLEKIDPTATRVVVATDSHTPTLGALPVLAIPVGSSLFAAAIAEGKIPFSIPPTIRVEFSGCLPPGTTIRDAQLELAANVIPTKSGAVVEFGGKGINTLTLEEVAALCNMVPEVFNAEMAVTEAFEAGINYLNDKFGIDKEIAYQLYGLPQPHCGYIQLVKHNLSETSPWIAEPGSPNNSRSLTSLKQFPKIDKAFLVSCTLGTQDLIQAAAVLIDQKVNKNTKLIIIPSSNNVKERCIKIGIYDIFRNSGALIINESACGPCVGEGLGSVKAGEIAITASNRNFPGRMGDVSAKVYMGGSLLTALSAVLGHIATPEEFRSHIPRITENLKNLT